MRIVLFLAATLAATPALAQDEARPAAYANAEACLREKAADAVHASSGAADAADFLLTYLCAGPVSAASAWQRNTASLAAMKQMFAGMTRINTDMDERAETADPSNAPPDTEATVIPPPTGDGASDISGLFDGASVDPVTGEFVMDPAKETTFGAIFGNQLSAANQVGGDQRPAFLRELAGRLVLERRR